ncbi:DUF4435 domain-containing protein [Myxococcus xanthus]|uniref:DUF4435 domain-containing protein n=1 Tax=Myxococcus xanthus TaxID=34 RepID=A0A7Y4MQ59_MYXXA|nr:DUF4435 domain-containing protein [Myxococcus xanthus]NOJ78164.1 DUF4435 domain-containing protein [Myxococcus xanthus]NOJ85163.1 DUF4435 domain-containing protein [Myxococcus xanthus]
MSYVDYLRKQRDVYAAIWLQFCHAYQKNSADVFVFFEGHDDLAFFMPELRRRGQNSALTIKPFVCRGKRTVLKLIPVVRARLDRPGRAIFFVDKDIDEFVGPPAWRPEDPFVYETKWYSIENYIVSEEAYHWVWTDLMRLSSADPRLGEMVKSYRYMSMRFVRIATVLMAWSLFHRKHGRRPNLNNLELSKLIRLDGSGRIVRHGKMLGLLDQLCGVASPARVWRGVRAAVEQFRRHDAKVYVRGKFELWFFVQFVRLSIEVLRAMPVPKSLNQNPDTRVMLTGDNAVTLLSGRGGGLPRDAIEFLDVAWRGIAANSE